MNIPKKRERDAKEAVFEKTEDFQSLYANNTCLENSIWDLKLVFGQLDLSAGEHVEQHTAITMPWMQAKLLAYALQVQIAAYESEFGTIAIPPPVLPPVPAGTSSNPRDKAFIDYLGTLHRQFFGSKGRKVLE